MLTSIVTLKLMNKYLLLLLGIIPAFFNANAQVKKDSTVNELNTYFKPVKWRNIGPFRGGRSVTATGVVDDVYTYYKV